MTTGLRNLTTICLASVFAFGLAACGGSSSTTPDPTPEEECMDAGGEWANDMCTTAEELAAERAANQRSAIETAIEEAETAVAAVNNDSTDAEVSAADTAIANARSAIMAAADVPEAERTANIGAVDAIASQLTAAKTARQTAIEELAAELAAEARAAMQRSAIETAIDAAETAVAAVNNDSTDAEVSAADTAIANARSAIMAAADVPEAERTANIGVVDAIASQLTTAKTARQTAMDDAQDAADMALAATAAKLYIGIGAPTDAVSAETRRHADYGDTVDNADDIAVSIGTAAAVNLSEDKDAMVAAHHGWEGKKYTAAPDGGGTYEAIVYSNVGDPTEGNPFNMEHTLDATTGELEIDTETEAEVIPPAEMAARARVASPSFDQPAGTKLFELAENKVRVIIPGSYHGVSGTYYCTPVNIHSDCSATVAESGFRLWRGTWTFKPTDPEARVMSTPDAIYASYGWWIHKSADDATYTASAFVSDKGTVPEARGITDLRGTATYMGGAAGIYALWSSTGGTNDAGHFTADAMLEADFNDDTISGTIDNFTGADGEARSWSVELKEAGITDVGAINRADADDTVWTIGGTAAAASGEWSGVLKEYDFDSQLPRIVTGTFSSKYGGDGTMVGAFGANKE